MTVWDQLANPAVLAQEHWDWNGSEFKRNTYGGIFEAARRAAAGLRKRGLEPGGVVPAVMTNGPSVAAGMVGTWMAGGALASLPIIARGMTAERYAQQILQLAALLDSQFILVEERFIAMLPENANIGIELVSYESLVNSPSRLDPNFPAPDDTVLIQFSSGTTGQPRGAELTTSAIEAQLLELANGLELDPKTDVGYTWLPLSHDMGLIGCVLLAWYTGIRGAVSPPERFLQSPGSWLEDCADFGATMTGGPPFALDLAVRAERLNPSSKNLSVRCCLVGAERIDWDVLVRAAAALGHRGLDLSKFTSAYGLAEATLAVAIGDLDAPPSTLDVDVSAIAEGSVQAVAEDHEDALRVVSTGPALPGSEVSIDPSTSEILVRSSSLASGYFGNKEATAERFQGGVLRTGDLGFLHDGELFITGRSDDLVVIGGRNVYVEALEAELGDRKGIRKGDCAIVDVAIDSRTQIGLVVELKSADDPDAVALADDLKQQIVHAVGLGVDRVVLVPPGVFPKTPSGKAQRYRCRELVSEAPGRGTHLWSSPT